MHSNCTLMSRETLYNIPEPHHFNITIMEKEWFDAVIYNDIILVKNIINQGIDINIQTKHGSTALIIASFNGNRKIVELLLKQPDININIKNINAWTSLSYSSIYNRKDIVKLLLIQPEINITIKDNRGNIFIDFFKNRSFLINYKLQKEILKNGREDIIIFFNKYNLVHPDVKKENMHLFKAHSWGLI
jgi:hypothetical protein